MIQTSELYQQLFKDGAVQDYRLVIDGVDYYSDAIYDEVKVSQKLFDKPTFTVGSFTISELNAKLRIPSSEIETNASIVFYYRYTDGEQTSEWIRKFSGNITKREQFDNEVTTIQAKSKAYNYDLFINNIEVSAYPANAREVALKCANHLGLTLDNPSDIINENIVEYPNELTVVQVLQRIAASSGGNWIITEEDELRLVVLRDRNLIPENARKFQSPPWVKYQGAEVDVTPAPMAVFDEGYTRNIVDVGVSGTVNGVTITFNDDGSFTLNGTSTASSSVYIISNRVDTEGIATVALFTNMESTQYNFILRVYKPDNTFIDKLVQGEKTTSLVDLDYINRVSLRFQEGNTFNGETFKLKIEKGGVATDWTPAWEDLPIEDKPVSFIETSGGSSTLKYLINLGAGKANTAYEYQVEVKNVGDNVLNVAPNTTSIKESVLPNEYKKVDMTYFQYATSNVFMTFQPDIVENNLSFYAYQPSVIEGVDLVFPAQDYEASQPIPPLKKVTAFYDDESAFEAGVDGYSELQIDNPWATQTSTDYVLNVLDDFNYEPAKGKKVYLDPSYQVGDAFEYENGQLQIIANVDWTFSGATVADVEAPISDDKNFDDPYSVLAQQQFKRKVTLGDSYQGVSIGRQDGIKMLLSPDGTEENALGRWYSNLEKGMAFQTRNSPQDNWFDWMYFDMNEKVFKLSMYSTSEEIDGELAILDNRQAEFQISLDSISGRVQGNEDNYAELRVDVDGVLSEVGSMLQGNIIPNLDGKEGYKGWTLESDSLDYIRDLTVPPLSTWENVSNVENVGGANIVTISGGISARCTFTNLDPNLSYKFSAVITAEGQGGYVRGMFHETPFEVFGGQGDMYVEAIITGVTQAVLDIEPYRAYTFMIRNQQVGEYESGILFEIIDIPSLSGKGLSFLSPGRAITGYGYVIPDTQYSFRGVKYSGQDIIDVSIVEYDSNFNFTSETTFTIDSDINDKTITPNQNTEWVRLYFNYYGNNGLVLTDMMFNRGQPKDYMETDDTTRAWAQSMFDMQGSQIEIAQSRLNSVDHRINNTTVKITGDKGVEIWNDNGKGLTVRNDYNEKVIELNSNGDLITRNMYAENAVISGSLQAGSVGDWEIANGIISSNGGVIQLDSIREIIKFGGNELSYVSNSNYSLIRIEGNTSSQYVALDLFNESSYGHSSVQATGRNGLYTATMSTDPDNITGAGFSFLGGNSHWGVFEGYWNDNVDLGERVWIVGNTLSADYIVVGGVRRRITRDNNGFLKAI